MRAKASQRHGRGRLRRAGHPVCTRLSITDHLKLGARLNPGWDTALAWHRITKLGLDPAQRARTPSGEQRAQLALALGVAKRPRLLILDEPVAALDPLACSEFITSVRETVAEQSLSVVLSSHLVQPWNGSATTSSCWSPRA